MVIPENEWGRRSFSRKQIVTSRDPSVVARITRRGTYESRRYPGESGAATRAAMTLKARRRGGPTAAARVTSRRFAARRRGLFGAQAREESAGRGLDRRGVLVARATLVLGYPRERLLDVVTAPLPGGLGALLARCLLAHDCCFLLLLLVADRAHELEICRGGRM